MSAGRRVWFPCGVLVISLLLCGVNADGTIKEFTDDPTGNVNLSPFQQWRSAYECLQNKSDSCPGNFTLTEYGLVNVPPEEKNHYCLEGCAEHTKAVLTCISLVKPDYKFVNKAKVQDINDTITHGCSFGFNGTTMIFSNARRISKSQIAFFVSMLPVFFLVNYLYV